MLFLVHDLPFLFFLFFTFFLFLLLPSSAFSSASVLLGWLYLPLLLLVDLLRLSPAPIVFGFSIRLSIFPFFFFNDSSS